MSHQAESKEGKMKASTAILESKEWPYRLVVDEAVIDDNSVVTLHTATMEKLQLIHGDTILIKGKKRKDTVCIAVGDETCEEAKIRMNEVIRSNLRVGLGDVVCVHHCPNVKIAERVDIRPLDDTIYIGDLFDVYIKPYFLEWHRPVRKGDHFIVRGRGGMRSVEFKVNETGPVEYCVVGPKTLIFLYRGEPVSWEDEKRLDDDVGCVRKQMAQLFNLIGEYFTYWFFT